MFSDSPMNSWLTTNVNRIASGYAKTWHGSLSLFLDMFLCLSSDIAI